MRRNRFVPEPDAPPDQDLEALQATLKLLKPIRQNRQSKAEREWRRQKQKLAELKQKAEQQQQYLQQQQQQFLQQREQMANDNQARAISYENLKNWMGKEKQMIEQIEQLNRDLQAIFDSCLTQEQQVETALAEVNLQIMEIERLGFMQQELQQASLQ